MKVIYLMVVLVMSLPAVAANQTEEETESAQVQAPSGRPIEEIQVISERTMSSLRYQISQARDNLFSTFNELNTDDNFDVNCRLTNNARTRIQKEICDPVFFDLAVAQNTQDANPWGTAYVSDVLKSEDMIRKLESANYQKLREIMLEIAGQNEEFAAELVELANMNREKLYREQECLKKPAVLFLFRKW